jgi:methionyl-tRNA formyltransferase
MHGNKVTICIAGKNQCAIDALKFVIDNYSKSYEIIALINPSDKGRDHWQYSFKKFAKKNNVKILSINEICKIKNLYFFSLEYEKIIDTKKFYSKKLYNIHFSLLPKYRGCHTNFFQIFNGEKFSGVTLHQINNGIDTGDIISQHRFKIP